MHSVFKFLGISILCGITAACSGTAQKSDTTGTISLKLPASYSEDTEAYLQEPGGVAGVKKLMSIKNTENSAFCRFNEVTYRPQDSGFKNTPQLVSASFADEFSRALNNVTDVKPAGVAKLTSMKLPIADYDAWLGALRFSMKQSLLEYYMDSHTLAIQVPGSTAQNKKFIVSECRIVGHPGQLAYETNELMVMYESIKLNAAK